MSTVSRSKLSVFVYGVILLFLLSHTIDFLQSFAYLNAYGFEHEVNPLITNNKELILVKVTVLLYAVIWSSSVFLIDKFSVRGGVFVKWVILVVSLTGLLVNLPIILSNQLLIFKKLWGLT